MYETLLPNSRLVDW